MRFLFALLLFGASCDDNNNNNNTCGELANQPCCPGTSKPEGDSCTTGAFCADQLATYTCSCQSGAWVCHDSGPRDLSVTSTD